MFDPLKEEEIKEVPDKPDFRFINENQKSLKQSAYKEIFPVGNDDRHALANINRYLKYYDIIEMEALCETAHQYKNYFPKGSGYGYISFFRALRFLLCIQGGMSRFDAYVDAFHDLETIRDFIDGRDTSTKKKRQIMNAVASYSNNRLVITLAQALDAPIQISYQGYKHQMIEVLRDIAVNGTSQREKVNAANSLLQHLNPNEMSALQINIGVQKKEKSFIDQAQEALKLLAGKKLEDIKAGTRAEDIINVDIIETTSNERKEDE